MNATARLIGVVRSKAARVVCLVCVHGFRYASVLAVVPLFSSACLFAFRLTLAMLGTHV